MQLERFSGEWWNRYTQVDMSTGCINWTGTRCKEGRGRTWYNGRGGVPVYRVVYEQCYGAVAGTLKVCHSCDNPSCVNPYHLFLGTQRDNLRDMFAKGRARPQGHAPGVQRARAVELFTAGTSRPEIAKALQVSRARVNQILLDAGFSARRRRKAPLAPEVALRELASESSHEVALLDREYILCEPKESRRGGAIGWRTVLGVPPVEPTRAVQLWSECPPQRSSNRQPASVASGWCADAATPVLPALRRSLRRA